ncbi:hypothetical protein FisN_4Lh131 [Fistulifera solaris]|uniref:Uncharacterized protein n=1 Tax=Fistulifera solaris TaxID=1519565 RepID=A0A1Z5JZ15_FISSO|nr:hypothetical protein FisN_4Lh131 [Fistulifera solaris]|eukprot:GAX19293.1 hypothetical protein FisN_4Lh131 [Fistulifera solaris]
MQFHCENRSPVTVDDLFKDMKGTQIIWLNDESFIMLKRLPNSVPDNSPFRTASLNINFERETVQIYGKSYDSVARVTARLLCLKDEKAEEVRVAVRDSRRESIVLASHPDPLYVGLECKHEVVPFCRALAQRTSNFGILSFQSSTFDCYFSVSECRVGSREHSEALSVLSKVSLETNSGIFHSSQCLKARTAYPAKHVEYTILHPHYFADIEPFTIASQGVTLVFASWFPFRLHTLFLQASGSLKDFGMIYHFDHPPNKVQEVELLEAIASNENLHRLELGCFSILDSFWDQLAQVIGSHKTLRTVVFRVQIDPGFHLMAKLIALMKEHIHLDVSFKFHGSSKDLWWKLDNTITPIRLQNQVRCLTQESVHDRSTIFGAALTTWACGDFLKVSLLLSENVDHLCSLVGHACFSVPQRREIPPVELSASQQPKKQKSS